MAIEEALAVVRKEGDLPVPMHIRNAPTGLMKGLGYGKGYKYAHDYDDALVDQEHLPDSLSGRRYYRPTDRGHEARIKQRMEEWAQRRSAGASPNGNGNGSIGAQSPASSQDS